MVSYEESKDLFRENMVKKLNMDFFKNLFRILDKNKQVSFHPKYKFFLSLLRVINIFQARVNRFLCVINDPVHNKTLLHFEILYYHGKLCFAVFEERG